MRRVSETVERTWPIDSSLSSSHKQLTLSTLTIGEAKGLHNLFTDRGRQGRDPQLCFPISIQNSRVFYIIIDIQWTFLCCKTMDDCSAVRLSEKRWGWYYNLGISSKLYNIYDWLLKFRWKLTISKLFSNRICVKICKIQGKQILCQIIPDVINKKGTLISRCHASGPKYGIWLWISKIKRNVFSAADCKYLKTEDWSVYISVQLAPHCRAARNGANFAPSICGTICQLKNSIDETISNVDRAKNSWT